LLKKFSGFFPIKLYYYCHYLDVMESVKWNYKEKSEIEEKGGREKDLIFDV